MTHDRGEIKAACGNILASLKNDRFDSLLNASKGGEHAGGSAANDDDTTRIPRKCGIVGCRCDILNLRAVQSDFQTQLYLDLALPCIDRTLAHAQFANARQGKLKLGRGCGFPLGFRFRIGGPVRPTTLTT